MVVEKGDNPPHEGDGRSHHSYTNLVRFSSTNLPLTTFDPFLNSAVCEYSILTCIEIDEASIDDIKYMNSLLDIADQIVPNRHFIGSWPGERIAIRGDLGESHFLLASTNNSHVAPIQRRTQVRWTTLRKLLKTFANQELPRKVRVDYHSMKTKEPFACAEVIEVTSDQGPIECVELRLAPVSGVSKLLEEFTGAYEPEHWSNIGESIVSKFGWRARIRLEEIA